MWFHRRHTIRHSLWFALKSVILFSAITHLCILSYTSWRVGVPHLHYLDIIDLDLLWGPGVLIGHWALWLVPITLALTLLYRYDQKH